MSSFQLSVAPMMAYTDSHYRVMMRLITERAVLYTEMLNVEAVIHNNRLLRFDPCEHPVVLQLGGNSPRKFAAAATIAKQHGYNEINLNIGCPSPRVQSGQFGACLMMQPELVADCVDAIRQVVDCPVTVKTRIGVDNQDSYDFLQAFVSEVSAVGCETFIIHARKAWLNGLSPKQNRDIPPLDYSRVYQLKADFTHLRIMINGGFTELPLIIAQQGKTDGVMVGRAAYHSPWLMYQAERALSNLTEQPVMFEQRMAVVERYLTYMREKLAAGTSIRAMSRHLIHLFDGLAGAKKWRANLSSSQHLSLSDISGALKHIEKDNTPSVVH